MTTLVYVDNSQLHTAAMAALEGMNLLPDGRLDYQALHQLVAEDTTPRVARLYGSKGYGKRLWNDAQEAGFETSVFVRSPNNKEKEVTCAMVTDMVADAITLAQPGDVFVVVAGDRDYLPAIQRIRKLGFRVTVVFFEGRTDDRLRQASTRFVGLNDHFQALCKPPHASHAADVFAEQQEALLTPELA